MIAAAPAGRLKPACVAVLLFALVSAVWVETDTYRVAALILVLWGVIAYMVVDFRPTIGLMGFACLGWVAMVAIRYIAVYLAGTGHPFGASEGIYLLPALYMTVGYMMFLYRRLLAGLVVAFLVTSLLVTAVSLDYPSLLDGGFHGFLYMNNTIHSSVAGGLIVLAAINVAAYASSSVPDRNLRWGLEAIAYLVVMLCLVGLYGAKSKGVWVAIVIAFCVQAMMSVRLSFKAAAHVKAAVLLCAFLAFVWFFASGNWDAIGHSYGSVETVVAKAISTGHPLATLREAIASGSVPESTNVRLMLWHNAIEVWSKNIAFGTGIAWRDLYESTFYKDVGFDIVHNGYLEIGMRYGFFGLGCNAVLYAWTIVAARLAVLRGLVPVEAYRFHVASLVFFFVTMTSNSNNTLAIGETFMLTAAAFGFYCFYRIQEQDFVAARDSAGDLGQPASPTAGRPFRLI